MTEQMLDSIPELRDWLAQHPGQRIADAIREMGSPVGMILIPNGQHLIGHLQSYQPLVIRQHIPYPEVNEFFDAFLRETVRLTHNVVASVATVIDITRVTLKREWDDDSDPIRIDFAAAVEIFQTDGELVFIRDLRNFCLHRALPPVQAQEKWHATKGHSASILLNTETLLQWDGWKAPAKELLKAAGPTIELEPLVSRYIRQTRQLYESTVASVERHEAGIFASWQQGAARHDELVAELRARMMRERGE